MNDRSGEDAEPNQNEHAKPQSVGGTYTSEEEGRKIHYELCSLMDKYEEIAKRMRASLSVE